MHVFVHIYILFVCYLLAVSSIDVLFHTFSVLFVLFVIFISFICSIFSHSYCTHRRWNYKMVKIYLVLFTLIFFIFLIVVIWFYFCFFLCVCVVYSNLLNVNNSFGLWKGDFSVSINIFFFVSFCDVHLFFVILDSISLLLCKIYFIFSSLSIRKRRRETIDNVGKINCHNITVKNNGSK